MIDDRIIGGMKGEGGKRTDICIIDFWPPLLLRFCLGRWFAPSWGDTPRSSDWPMMLYTPYHQFYVWYHKMMEQPSVVNLLSYEINDAGGQWEALRKRRWNIFETPMITSVTRPVPIIILIIPWSSLDAIRQPNHDSCMYAFCECSKILMGMGNRETFAFDKRQDPDAKELIVSFVKGI